MKWLKEYMVDYFIKDGMKKVIIYLRGKKTILGLVQTALGLAIVIGARVPEAQYAGTGAAWIVDLLGRHGLDMADALLISGPGFTLVGFIDKVQRFFRDKTEVKVTVDLTSKTVSKLLNKSEMKNLQKALDAENSALARKIGNVKIQV